MMRGVFQSLNFSQYIQPSFITPFFTFEISTSFSPPTIFNSSNFSKSNFELMLPFRIQLTHSKHKQFCGVDLQSFQVNSFKISTRSSLNLSSRYMFFVAHKTIGFVFDDTCIWIFDPCGKIHKLTNNKKNVFVIKEQEDLRTNPFQERGNDGISLAMT